jgi:biopolymer transport protein ExbD
MNLRRTRGSGDAGGTSALNDILFILLFFFLIISTLANPNLVKVSVPRATSDSKAKQTVVVTVDSMQQFFIGHVLSFATHCRAESLQPLHKPPKQTLL